MMGDNSLDEEMMNLNLGASNGQSGAKLATIPYFNRDESLLKSIQVEEANGFKGKNSFLNSKSTKIMKPIATPDVYSGAFQMSKHENEL